MTTAIAADEPADHPHHDPGDGRTECSTCGKYVWPAIHSCKGVPVTAAAKTRSDAHQAAKGSLLASLTAFGVDRDVLPEEVDGWAADVVAAVGPILARTATAEAADEPGRPSTTIWWATDDSDGDNAWGANGLYADLDLAKTRSAEAFVRYANPVEDYHDADEAAGARAEQDRQRPRLTWRIGENRWPRDTTIWELWDGTRRTGVDLWPHQLLTAEPVRPTIVCLCGSTRFYEAFQQANYDETMAGRIVLSVGFYPHAKAEHGHGEGVGHDSAEKVALDELHKRKIDLADEILVLNVGGYVGDSTRSEIAYAVAAGKAVRWLETAEPVSVRVCTCETITGGHRVRRPGCELHPDAWADEMHAATAEPTDGPR